MGYSRKTCERLVMAADEDGRITFAQIRKVFPDWDSSFFYDMIGDNFAYSPLLNDARMSEKRFETVMLFWETCPEDYVKGYIFKDTDLFNLSVKGEDIRYAYRESLRNRRIAKTAAIASVIAAVASVIALLR